MTAARGETRDAAARPPGLTVYLTCPPDEALGSAYVALGFARRLAGRGHRVEVVPPERYEPLRGWRRARFYRQSAGLAWHALREAFRGRNAMVFYGGEAWLAIALLRRLPRRPLLVVHSNGLESHVAERMRGAIRAGVVGRPRWYQLDLSRLAERGQRRADGLVVVSPFEAEFARRRGLPASGRLLVLENPLPDSFLDVATPAVRERVVGFCGAWAERKGAAWIRRELPIFLRRNPEWRLRFLGAGDGHLRDEFAADVRDRVEAIPSLARESALAREYERLAILVSASVYESFGLVVAEAMARGCAVVAAPVGFAAGLRDREEILWCDPAPSGALAAALEEVARDEQLRDRLARGGRERVGSLRWEPAVDRLESALATWAKEAQRG